MIDQNNEILRNFFNDVLEGYVMTWKNVSVAL